MKRKGLTYYLTRYYKLQEEILLVYRPTQKSSWGVRHLYLSDEYNPYLPYNHRSILRNEVVIEFDNDDPKINYDNTEMVRKKLSKYNIKYAYWDSGNRSKHIHFFVDVAEAGNVTLLKKTLVRFFSKGCSELPDLRVCSDNHLIRAEYGIHEKTLQHKSPIFESRNYPELSPIPVEVWDNYSYEYRKVLNWKMSTNTKELYDHAAVKLIIDNDFIRKYGDGRERLFFVLMHIFKPKYEKDDLTKFLWEWYKYNGGYKMSYIDIRNKVNYHYTRDYNITPYYLREQLEEVGVEKEVLEEVFR